MSRRSPCLNGEGQPKYPYESEAEANEEVSRVIAASGDPRVRAYRCPVCRAFHVGHRGRSSAA